MPYVPLWERAVQQLPPRLDPVHALTRYAARQATRPGPAAPVDQLTAIRTAAATARSAARRIRPRWRADGERPAGPADSKPGAGAAKPCNRAVGAYRAVDRRAAGHAEEARASAAWSPTWSPAGPLETRAAAMIAFCDTCRCPVETGAGQDNLNQHMNRRHGTSLPESPVPDLAPETEPDTTDYWHALNNMMIPAESAPPQRVRDVLVTPVAEQVGYWQPSSPPVPAPVQPVRVQVGRDGGDGGVLGEQWTG